MSINELGALLTENYIADLYYYILTMMAKNDLQVNANIKNALYLL